MQKTGIIFTGMSLAMLLVIIPPALAQYDVVDKGLYQQMEKSKEKVELATREGAVGAGVPIFAADGVLGASIISAGIFGGIAATLFIRGRKGRYAAMGRG